jgi:hypothetical protein
VRVLQSQHDLLHIGDAIAIQVAQQHNIPWLALRYIDVAVVRGREDARIVQSLREALDRKSGSHLQFPDTLVRRGQPLRLINVAFDGDIGELA